VGLFDDLPREALFRVRIRVERRRARLDLGFDETRDGLQDGALVPVEDENIFGIRTPRRSCILPSSRAAFSLARRVADRNGLL